MSQRIQFTVILIIELVNNLNRKIMSLKKQYSKTKPVCKVTFTLSDGISAKAHKVNLAGDFNNWDVESMPMKKSKSGDFSATVELEKGKEYQFRYIIDGKKWLNESEADRLVHNHFNSENSLISL